MIIFFNNQTGSIVGSVNTSTDVEAASKFFLNKPNTSTLEIDYLISTKKLHLYKVDLTTLEVISV